MTREDIIRMAREAGFDTSSKEVYVWLGQERVLKELVTFAALVAAAEREACAKVCEILINPNGPVPEDPLDAWLMGTVDCATAVRARGEK